MKILMIHNEYQQLGGEDIVFANEYELLRQHQHEVEKFIVTNKSIESPMSKLRAALNIAYSTSSKNDVADILKRSKPDLVHVHNFFPLLTPSIYDACLEAGIPTVQTLHNYRLICANALLMREGKVCEDCLHGSAYQAVLHGCYRNSRLASLPVAHMVTRHKKEKTWEKKVTQFIALTHFAKNKFIEAGFPKDKITVKLNFIPDPLPLTQRTFKPIRKHPVGLFVGRLSPEKGVHILLKAWKHLQFPIRVIGEGPLLEEVRNCGLSHVEVLGKKTQPEVWQEMQNADFLIMPSECYEGFALVLIEAFANSLPVIVSGFGSQAEIVQDQVTGLHFSPGDPLSLTQKATLLAQSPDLREKIGQRARQIYEEKYTPSTNYLQLMEIYQRAIQFKQN